MRRATIDLDVSDETVPKGMKLKNKKAYSQTWFNNSLTSIFTGAVLASMPEGTPILLYIWLNQWTGNDT